MSIDFSEEAIVAARDLAAHLDPRCAANLQGPLLAFMAHLAGITCTAVMPKLMESVFPILAKALIEAVDARVQKQVTRLLEAYLAAAPAPAASPLQVEIVAMPAPPPRTVSVELDQKGNMKKAHVSNTFHNGGGR